jgi:hypothetical protein
MPDAVEQAVESIWSRRLAWSGAADRLKTRLLRARLASLVFGGLGAILSATTVSVASFKYPVARAVLGWAGMAALALGTLVTRRLLSGEAVRNWARARSVAEAITAEIWGYRAGVDPYAGPDAALFLSDRVRELEKNVQDLEWYVGQVVPEVLTERERPPPAVSSADWIERRVLSQASDYYRKSAGKLARRLATLRQVEVILGVAAALCSALVGWFAKDSSSQYAWLGTGVAPWVAVLTTLGGAFGAHIAASRYDFLVMSYSATARHLEYLVERWRANGMPRDPKHWSEFVRECERAIAVQNETWLAKWAERQPGKGRRKRGSSGAPRVMPTSKRRR